MISKELKLQVIEKVKESKSLAKQKLGLDLPPLTINYDLTGHRAGVAYPSLFKIRLNEDYLVRFSEDMVMQTIPHEVAHIVANNYYHKQCAHGKLWCHIMSSVYNLLPVRTHNYGTPLNRNGSKRYILECTHCKFIHRLGPVWKRRIDLYGVTKFTCRVCKIFFSVNAKIMLDIR